MAGRGRGRGRGLVPLLHPRGVDPRVEDDLNVEFEDPGQFREHKGAGTFIDNNWHPRWSTFWKPIVGRDGYADDFYGAEPLAVRAKAREFENTIHSERLFNEFWLSALPPPQDAETTQLAITGLIQGLHPEQNKKQPIDFQSRLDQSPRKLSGLLWGYCKYLLHNHPRVRQVIDDDKYDRVDIEPELANLSRGLANDCRFNIWKCLDRLYSTSWASIDFHFVNDAGTRERTMELSDHFDIPNAVREELGMGNLALHNYYGFVQNPAELPPTVSYNRLGNESLWREAINEPIRDRYDATRQDNLDSRNYFNTLSSLFAPTNWRAPTGYDFKGGASRINAANPAIVATQPQDNLGYIYREFYQICTLLWTDSDVDEIFSDPRHIHDAKMSFNNHFGVLYAEYKLPAFGGDRYRSIFSAVDISQNLSFEAFFIYLTLGFAIFEYYIFQHSVNNEFLYQRGRGAGRFDSSTPGGWLHGRNFPQGNGADEQEVKEWMSNRLSVRLELVGYHGNRGHNPVADVGPDADLAHISLFTETVPYSEFSFRHVVNAIGARFNSDVVFFPFQLNWRFSTHNIPRMHIPWIGHIAHNSRFPQGEPDLENVDVHGYPLGNPMGRLGSYMMYGIDLNNNRNDAEDIAEMWNNPVPGAIPGIPDVGGAVVTATDRFRRNTDAITGAPLAMDRRMLLYGGKKRRHTDLLSDSSSSGDSRRKRARVVTDSSEQVIELLLIDDILFKTKKFPVIEIDGSNNGCFWRSLIIDDMYQLVTDVDYPLPRESKEYQQLATYLISEEGKIQLSNEAKELCQLYGYQWGQPVTDEIIQQVALKREKRIRLVNKDSLILHLMTPYLEQKDGKVVEQPMEDGLPDDCILGYNRLCFSIDNPGDPVRHIEVMKRDGGLNHLTIDFCLRCKESIKTSMIKHRAQCTKSCPSCLSQECPDFRALRLIESNPILSDKDRQSQLHLRKKKHCRKCEDCNRFFFGDSCFEQHQFIGEGMESVCEQWWQCMWCKSGKKLTRYHEEHRPKGVMMAEEYDMLTGQGDSEIPITARHECNVVTCRYCQKLVNSNDSNHVCYLSPPAKAPTIYPSDKWFVADFECSSHTPDRHHEANALFIKRADGEEYLIYENGLPIIKQFIDLIEKGKFTQKGSEEVEKKKEKGKRKKPQCLIFIFHNARAYDTNLILHEVYQRGHLVLKKPIFNGRKILHIRIGTSKKSIKNDIKIIDSLSFLTGSLRSLAYDWIPSEDRDNVIRMKKGWFPHKFNELNVERHAYQGSIPFLDKFYEDAADDLDFYFWWLKQWMTSHEQNVGLIPTDLQIEDVFILKSYLPVVLLREAWPDPSKNPWKKDQKLSTMTLQDLWEHKMIIDDSKFDPSSRTFIIALMDYYKYYSYVQLTQGLFVQDENKYYEKHWSFKDEFLSYLRQDVHVLYHVFNNFRNLAMELASLFPKDKTPVDPLSKFTLAGWVNMIYRSGFLPVDAIARNNREMSNKLRHYLMGARTENFAVYYEATPGKNHGESYDVSSQYPSQMSNNPFAIGGAKEEGKPDLKLLDDYLKPWLDGKKGKMFCCHIYVKPPSNLRVPVLPRRAYIKNLDGMDTKQYRLLFDLEEGWRYTNYKELCNAIKVGYKITDVDQILYWEESSDKLFKPYMELFYLLKTCAGGWKKLIADLPEPDQQYMKDHKLDFEQQKQYVREYYDSKSMVKIEEMEKRGWLTNESKPALKAMCKLILNSLWGKMAQRDDFKQMAFLRSENEDDVGYWHKLQNEIKKGTIVDLSWDPIFNDLDLGIRAEWKDNESYVIDEGVVMATSVQVGIFTTAYARSYLYDALHAIETAYGADRLLYCDTDSVRFWLYDHEKVPFPTGCRMGEWQDESDGDFIKKAVYGGPKQYMTETFKGKVKHCFRGFNTSRRSVRDMLSLEDFTNLVDSTCFGSSESSQSSSSSSSSKTAPKIDDIKVKQSGIKRGAYGDMTNIDFVKSYRVRQTKRQPYDKFKLSDDAPILASTFPFGYVE